jgi:hypothetical protein
LLQPDISIVQELRLPCFDRAPGMPLMAYPLPQPNFAVEFVNSIPPDTFDWRNWHEEIERRNGRLRAWRGEGAQNQGEDCAGAVADGCGARTGGRSRVAAVGTHRMRFRRRSGANKTRSNKKGAADLDSGP